MFSSPNTARVLTTCALLRMLLYPNLPPPTPLLLHGGDGEGGGGGNDSPIGEV